MQGQAQSSQVEKIAADSLRHAADCISELAEKGEPMGPRQTYRRGYNAADENIVESPLTGDKFEAAIDLAGDVAVMALENDIASHDAAEFYRNQAKEMV